ncbi:Ig-like domain repeat protein [Methanosphaera sp. WGK6]|uniref:Ig-like domain repeat protein n=1 Tax=Methanosphaera sp. WGK6 TaxID=1561964 RepID=UPI00084BFEDB|nr:Ig-like domain repeat protein [Methanosphaera sp. WGK6]OED30269.1 hypothetical protein NL43_03835 [Methanosphaera sp. WGK6]
MNVRKIFGILSIIFIVSVVSLSAISATDSDTSTYSENIVEQTQTGITNDISDIQTVNNDNKTSKTTDIKKTSVKNIKTENIQTVTDYDSLKTQWNNIQENGVNGTEYTINLKNGEYKISETLIANTSSPAVTITLNGEDVNKTIIDGQGLHKFIYINNKINNKNSVLKLNNLTIQNCLEDNSTGLGMDGGAIYAKNYKTIVDNCNFINNSIFIKNKLTGFGGAILTYNITVKNSTFKNNSAESGAALEVVSAGSIIEDSQFLNNNATLYAAVYFAGNLTVNRCEFINNTAGQASALYRVGYLPSLTMDRCTFINNSGHSAAYDSYWLYAGAPQNISNCVFINNTGGSRVNDLYLYGQWDFEAVANYTYFAGVANPVNSYSKSALIVDNIIAVLANNHTQGATVTQLEKQLIVKATAIGIYNDHEVTSIGNGYEIPLSVDCDYFNVSGVVLNEENKFTYVFDLTTLPENFDDFTIYADGVKVATVTYKKTDIEINPIISKAGQNITINATISENGMLLNKGKVAFKLNGKTIGHANVSLGTASLNYQIPYYTAKNYTITVVYGGTNKFSPARVNTTLTLKKLATKNTIKTTTVNNTLKITVETIDENNKPVTRGKLAVKINGATINTTTTTGNETIEYKIAKSWNNKKITITAIYGENSLYDTNRVNITETLSIQKNNTTTTQKTSLKSTNTTTTQKTSLKTADTNIYYVSNTGSDNNAGTESNPFKTIEKAINTINTTKQASTIYLIEGTYKGKGNTNLTVPGDLTIKIIGLGNTSIDGEVNYTIKTQLDPGEYYWGSSPIWYPYSNTSGNWAMNITKGNGKITIENLTIKNCWSPGGSSIAAYATANIDNYGNLEVNNVSFIFNHGGVGASIRNNNGSTLTVNNSLFDGNRKSSSTGNYGPGIYNNGTASVYNSLFQNNYARWGTITNDKIMTIVNCTLKDNIGYDGGSTYKTGSGITINTASTDFYASMNNTGVKTVIDGCTFINNEQLDVYADISEFNLTNSVFNKSTGVVVTGSSENYGITQIIANNTFVDSIGSTLYNSLSSTDKIILTLRLEAKYKYIIENNTVSGLTGTSSRAIELSADNSIIKNNTVDRTISINGKNNTIEENNITTSQDAYTIILKNGNNSVKNNYLYTNGYRGNAAVNSTSTTNIVENNLPEVVEITIDDESYNTFFDENGNLRPSFGTIEQITITGALTNKNIIINKTISIIQGNNKITSYNVTIKENGGKLDVSGLIIQNTNNNPIIILNNNGVVQKVKFQTNNEYAIILNGENNIIKNNELLADVLVGDNAVKSSQNNEISSNTPIYINYVLSEETYNTYFDEKGYIKQLSSDKDIHFMINGSLSNKNIILDNNKTVSILYYNNSVLYNTTITTLGTTNLNISNITIINNNNREAINLNTPTNTISYVNITTNANAINVINSTKLLINYNNINVNSKSNVTAISIKDSKTSISIQYNNITTKGLSTTVDETGHAGTTGIEALNTTGLIIQRNNLNTTFTHVEGEYDTIYSINLVNPELLTYVRILYNNIVTDGNSYAYGINMINQTVRFEYNNVSTEANGQATGLQATNINAYIADIYHPWGIRYSTFKSETSNSYGVILSAAHDLAVFSNKFYLNGLNAIGVNTYKTKNVTIVSDTFEMYNDNVKAIEIIDSLKTNITSNAIDIIAKNNTAIELLNTTTTLVTKNTIITNTKYSVLINENSYENAVTNNILYSEELADDSVLKLNSNNRVRENLPESITTDFYLTDSTYSQFFDENGILRNNVPAGIKIMLTGNLHDKVLNITKPLTIVSDGTTYYDCKLILSANEINITGAKFIGNNTKIIIDGNSSNLDFALDIEGVLGNQTIITINGNYNTINSTGTIDVDADKTNNNTNIIVEHVTGNYNTITHGYMYSAYSNNTILLFLENAKYNNITAQTLVAQYANRAVDVYMKNSDYNNFTFGGLQSQSSINFIGIILDNSSYNYISKRPNDYSASISVRGSNLESNMGLLLMNQSNHNNIIGITSMLKLNMPSILLILNSDFNNIYNCTLYTLTTDGFAVNITEGRNNTVEWNFLNSTSLLGDNAVIQEMDGETVQNTVRYNYGSTSLYKSSQIKLDDIVGHIGDMVELSANVTYRNGTMWNSPYVSIDKGYVVFKENGVVIGKVDVDETGFAKLNYTIPDTSKQLNISAEYYDTSLAYYHSSINKVLSVNKYGSSVLLSDVVSVGTRATIIAIVQDENKNIISSGKLAFKLNGVTIGYAFIEQNIAMFNVDITKYSPKNYTITAVYEGSNKYESARQNSTLVIQAGEPTSVQLTKQNSTHFKVSVMDSQEKLVNCGKIAVKINGVTINVTNLVNGSAIINYEIKKPVLVTVVYDGKNIYANNRVNITVTP